MILLRSLVFHAAFYLTTAALAIIDLPILLMDRHRVQDYAKFWTGSAVWLLEKICGTKIVWHGLETLTNFVNLFGYDDPAMKPICPALRGGAAR
jgi:1-acyl-sn-glycerol-3-phosphate acyltransferase